jgi:hypothetical protein
VVTDRRRGLERQRDARDRVVEDEVGGGGERDREQLARGPGLGPADGMSTPAAAAPERIPTPTLNSLIMGRLSAVIWVASTPSAHSTRASWAGVVQRRNISTLESKPTSMLPSWPSSTIGNLAMITINGTAISSTPVIVVPSRATA